MIETSQLILIINCITLGLLAANLALLIVHLRRRGE